MCLSLLHCILCVSRIVRAHHNFSMYFYFNFYSSLYAIKIRLFFICICALTLSNYITLTYNFKFNFFIKLNNHLIKQRKVFNAVLVQESAAHPGPEKWHNSPPEKWCYQHVLNAVI